MMTKKSALHAPKVLVNFTMKQMTNFTTSKEFKKRVMDFLFNVVDDVVTMVYNKHHAQ